MRALIDAIEAGAFGDVTGVLHIGIGGSVLGPALLVDALGRRIGDAQRPLPVEYRRRRVRRGGASRSIRRRPWSSSRPRPSPRSRRWPTSKRARHGCRRPASSDPDGRVIAVTARPEAAVEQGIDETRILPFGEGVGGRYSLWSSVGVTAALALGWDAFEELLEGAAEMDRHFRFAEPSANVPLIAAFADRLYVEKLGCQTRGVFAYDERLRLLPSYLQQLEMESNGKSVTRDGSRSTHPTAPVTWGGTGTDAQHAVFQLLHQGTVLVPVEFVAVREGDDDQDPSITACCCSTPSPRARR